MKPSGNAQVGTGGARRVPVDPPNATGDGPSPAINVSLAGFLLLFVASRLLYLVLINPGHLVLYHGGEELYRGTIAQELVTGLTIPFTEYRADNYSGGSLVIGALAAGFFFLFGPTVFALKLAPLLLFTLALVFWYWTIQRAAGERVAGYFAVLFCFSAPPFTDYSITAMGFHSESIFFSALTVFLLFRMLSDEGGSPAVAVLLGLTAGFGFWFAYIYGLTLLATLGFWLWYDKGMLRRPRVLWFALGFLVGFSPWILFNMQTHFAGFVIHNKNMWEHFGLARLSDDLAHPWKLAPVVFLRTIASNDSWDLYRRAANLLYSLLYVVPILTAGVLGLKRGRSDPAGTRASQPTLVGFGILYIVVLALAVQFSDFRADRYMIPAYPFLFFFVAHSLARCQDLLPRVQRKIQTVFLASVVVLGLGTHAPLLSLDRPGAALSAKGYAYAPLPWIYWETHAPAGSHDREFILEMVQQPYLSDILSKLSSEDQREFSRGIALKLADAVSLNGQAEDFTRIERLVPPGFDRYFYYRVGVLAMAQHAKELSKAVGAVEFLRQRSAAAHHQALVGIYRSWPDVAALDSSREALANAPAAVATELLPHYWRALGHLAGLYWYEEDHSLSRLNVHVQAFVPRLDPSVQRSFLQGVGQALLNYLIYNTPWATPAELERFPQAYQEGLFEGFGTILEEVELTSISSWKGHESPFWAAGTKGLSARSLSYIQQGKAEFEALFEGPALRAVQPLRAAP